MAPNTLESAGLILNVNDNQVSRLAFTRLLEGSGFRVIEARTGQEALDRLAENPDLVLLDLHLPDMSGYEVCRRIKRDPQRGRTPVVHVSAVFLDNEDWVASIERGAEVYLRQPVDPAVLVSMARTLIRARRVEEERNRLWEALRINEARFRVALGGSPIAVFNQDRELRYTWMFNPPAGLDAASFIGKTDREVLSPEDFARVAELKMRVVASGKGVREEVSLEFRGETRYFDMHVEPLRDVRGHIVGLTGAAVDITRTRQLEDKLRNTQKMESIGVLAGGVAHDFNNLLTGILGHASVAMTDLPTESPVRPQLEQVMLAGRRAAGLTNQLLAYAGKGRFVVGTVDLSRLVRETVGLIGSSLPVNVRVDLALTPDTPAITGDATQLQQLAMNLVINAGEAIGEPGGTIRVRTGLEEITAAYLDSNPMAAQNEIAPGTYVCLEVEDTGCGMDADTMARIFDPFFTTKFTGRGLGLAAVQGIVRGHKGALDLQSAPGRGTRFKVLFPAAAARRDAPAAKSMVLLADHEPEVTLELA